MTQAKRAFVFDMDGTIVDNMDFHTRSWVELFRRLDVQIDPDEFFRTTAGRQGKEILRAYLGEHLSDDKVAAMNHEKEEIYREMYEPHRKEVEGFSAFLAHARERGVMLAVATSGPPGNIAFVLDGLNLRRHFDAVVGAADVKRGKPHPDVFLAAADKVGVQPADCIVFEDAPLGVEAAKNAGMPAVVLSTTLDAAAFAAYDNVIRIASDFTELSVDDLLAA
ncbi:beta-phosphoglucomutase family hydrolase [Massilia solisilvae]|uniref:Beta-phosphoglucomutase family hydrolase n=1 Tax=Massilia solisilvae TaxID=1811225 RepID=A0ABT2BMK3_9BURK|nr:beta-phosphoglucomutase family hydrolase [Massilia solisilvae]MCS0609695.1 beta-phosphoglucomutase family hydrolase [Massilia solisilvae]